MVILDNVKDLFLNLTFDFHIFHLYDIIVTSGIKFVALFIQFLGFYIAQ